MTNIDTLSELIGVVDAAHGSIPSGAPRDLTEMRMHRDAGDRALAGLAEHGARWRQSGGITSLTLAGIRSTSTCGPAGVMGNWLAAARRRLERCEP